VQTKCILMGILGDWDKNLIGFEELKSAALPFTPD
jgi:hypothetical protein